MGVTLFSSNDQKRKTRIHLAIANTEAISAKTLVNKSREDRENALMVVSRSVQGRPLN